MYKLHVFLKAEVILFALCSHNHFIRKFDTPCDQYEAFWHFCLEHWFVMVQKF